MNDKNKLPEKEDIIKEHDEKVIDVLMGDPTLVLRFNGS